MAPIPKKIQVLCRTCSRPTNHDVLFTKESSGEEPEAIHWWHTHQVLQCRGCDAITFRTEASNSEEIDPYTGNPEEFETLYPSRADGRPPIIGYENFPVKTQKIYRETLKALHANALTLGAIGLRAIIESICLEQKTKNKVVVRAIDELVVRSLRFIR
jgi:hypothetical protein